MLYRQTIKAKLQMCCLRIDSKTTDFAVAAIAWEVTYNKMNYAETDSCQNVLLCNDNTTAFFSVYYYSNFSDKRPNQLK